MPNANCKWIITAPQGYDYIEITVNAPPASPFISLEESMDFLIIYDGQDFSNDGWLASITGTVNPSSLPVITSSTNIIGIQFTSDEWTEDFGWSITYACESWRKKMLETKEG